MLYGFGISTRLFSLILESNPSEALAYVSSLPSSFLVLFSSPLFLAFLVSIPVCVYLARRLFALRYAYIPTLILFAAACALSVYHVSHSNKSQRFSLSTLPRAATAYHRCANFLSNYEYIAHHYNPSTAVDSLFAAAQNVVFIIGESSNRNFWQLYGYPLRTTPLLAQMADSLIVFSDVLPPAGNTSKALANVLTFKNSTSNTDQPYAYPNIISLAELSHRRTYWFSNQERATWSQNTSFVGFISQQADVCQHLGYHFFDELSLQRLDQELLPLLSSALADSASRRLIVLHMICSHNRFVDTYPPSFNVFSAVDFQSDPRPWLTPSRQQTLAEYHNAILYTDWFIHQVIQSVSQSTSNSVVFYLSDHSIEVFDQSRRLGHNTQRFTTSSFVPMLLWADGAFRAANPTLVDNLRLHTSLRISSDNIIHTLSTLLGVHTSDYIPSSDLASPAFAESPRFFEGQRVD